MQYVIIELSGLPQLQRIAPGETRKAVGKIDASFMNHGWSKVAVEPEYLLYRVESGMRNTQDNLEIILKTKGVLQGLDEQLLSWSMAVDRREEEAEEPLIEAMKRLIWQGAGLEEIWLSSDAAAYFDRFLQTEVCGEVYKLKDLKKGSGGETIALPDFLEAGDVIERIRERVAESLDSSGELLLVHGPSLMGKRQTIDLVQDKAGNRQYVPGWIRMSKSERNDTITHPFEGCIDRDFLHDVPLYLNETEKKVWEEKRNFLTMECPDRRVDDFLIGFRLYLAAYIQCVEQNMEKPVVICEEIHAYRQETLELLFRIFDEYTSLIPICTSSAGEVIKDLPALVSFYVPPLSEKQIKKIVGEFLPDHSNSLDKLVTASEGRLLPLFHALILEKQGQLGDASDVQTLTKTAVKELPFVQKKVLYAYAITDGILSAEDMHKALVYCGIKDDECRSACKALSASGFIRENRTVLPDTAVCLRNDPFLDTKELERRLAEFLFQSWQSRDMHFDYVELLRFIDQYGTTDQVLRLFYRGAGEYLDAKDKRLDALMQSISAFRHSQEAGTKVDTLLYIIRLRKALMEGNKAEADSLFILPEHLDVPDDHDLRSDLQLQTARYLFATHEPRKALIHAKEALMIAQEGGNTSLEIQSNIELGLIMLRLERVEEGMEYFFIAREVSKESGKKIDHIRGIAFQCMGHFFRGNFSRALMLIEEALQYAVQGGAREWELYLYFLRGRVRFAIGDYAEAEECFQSCLVQCQIYNLRDLKPRFYAWISRSRIYRGDLTGASLLVSQPEDPEVLFFRSEAAYLKRDYVSAVAYAEQGIELIRGREPDFISSEIMDWSSGFAPVEDWTLGNPSGGGVLLKQLQAFLAFVNGMVKPSTLPELIKLTREERLAEVDPHNRLYFFYCVMAIPERNNEDTLDRLTFLSKALKYVQELGSRNDLPREKQGFLYRNYWNSRLMAEGKKYKLV